MDQINAWLKAEDAAIENLVEMIEDVIAVYMDQSLEQFSRSGLFITPTNEAVSQLVDTLSIGWTEAIELGSSRQIEMIQSKQTGITARAVVEYVRTYGLSRTRSIVNTTARQLVNLVISGQRRGLTTVEIARELTNKIPDLARARAQIIAATEIHSAAQFGSYNAALRSSRLLKKIWNTVEDDRVRDFRTGSRFSHQMMQGVKSALDIPFRVPHYTGTFEPIRFPGDPEGSAGNIINCRCMMTYEEA